MSTWIKLSFFRLLCHLIINGQVITPIDLNDLIKVRLRKNIPDIVEALNGRLRLHHRNMIRFSWEHILYLEKTIAAIEAEIQQELLAYQEAVDLITSLSLIKEHTAAVIMQK